MNYKFNKRIFLKNLSEANRDVEYKNKDYIIYFPVNEKAFNFAYSKGPCFIYALSFASLIHNRKIQTACRQRNFLLRNTKKLEEKNVPSSKKLNINKVQGNIKSRQIYNEKGSFFSPWKNFEYNFTKFTLNKTFIKNIIMTIPVFHTIIVGDDYHAFCIFTYINFDKGKLYTKINYHLSANTKNIAKTNNYNYEYDLNDSEDFNEFHQKLHSFLQPSSEIQLFRLFKKSNKCV